MATLVTNHLRQRYSFSPVVAEALSDDLQLLSHEMNGASQLAEGQILYPAVKADEPSGKALKDCQYVMVRLTMFARSDIVFQQRHNLKELKKRVLQRITEEADAQRAPLTYEDLSRLLFADRKTIAQYIRELRAEGKTIVTRATYTDASATISHHRPIPSTSSGQASGSFSSTTPRPRSPDVSITPWAGLKGTSKTSCAFVSLIARDIRWKVSVT